MDRQWKTDEEERQDEFAREQRWLETVNYHMGEKRVMRNGCVVEIVDIFWAFAKYWGHNRPYVRLKILTGLLKDTEIERAWITVMSYPLVEEIDEVDVDG